MPTSNLAGPPCPNCRALETERLPFVKEGETLPVYSCLGCGYVWRQPIAKHGASRDDDAGKP